MMKTCILKTIIVDDAAGCDALKNMLSTHFSHVEVKATCQSIHDARKAIEMWEPDLVFLNVKLPHESGFDLLNDVHDATFEVIFTAPCTDFALRAIKFLALDYLIKPIAIEDLRDAIAKAERKHRKKAQSHIYIPENDRLQENEKIALPTIDGFTFVRISDIVYFQASGNYTELFLVNGEKVLVSRQLKEYENCLSKANFFRIHHSYLVNLKYVKSYVKRDGGYVVMSNNVMLDISRRKKDAFLDRILHEI